MKRIEARMRFAAAVLALGLIGASSVAQVNGITTLDDLRDRARPLLIFAPKPDDPRLEIQVRTLTEHAAEAHDRDLVAIALPYNNPSPPGTQLSPNDAQAVRRRFHVGQATSWSF